MSLSTSVAWLSSVRRVVPSPWISMTTPFSVSTNSSANAVRILSAQRPNLRLQKVCSRMCIIRIAVSHPNCSASLNEMVSFRLANSSYPAKSHCRRVYCLARRTFVTGFIATFDSSSMANLRTSGKSHILDNFKAFDHSSSVMDALFNGMSRGYRIFRNARKSVFLIPSGLKGCSSSEPSMNVSLAARRVRIVPNIPSWSKQALGTLNKVSST